MSKYSIDGKVFSFHRNKLDLSVRKMAGKLQIDHGNLSKIEKNKIKASVKAKLALAEFFDTTYAQLKIEYVTLIDDQHDEKH